MTQLPSKGELWCYDSQNSIPCTYLILDAEYRNIIFSTPEFAEKRYTADILCLDNGEYYMDYVWPDHTWKRVG